MDGESQFTNPKTRKLVGDPDYQSTEERIEKRFESSKLRKLGVIGHIFTPLASILTLVSMLMLSPTIRDDNGTFVHCPGVTQSFQLVGWKDSVPAICRGKIAVPATIAALTFALILFQVAYAIIKWRKRTSSDGPLVEPG